MIKYCGYPMQVTDLSVWNEIVAKQKTHGAGDLDQSESLSVDPARNVHDFGILMLEIVSGKVPNPEEPESLLNLVSSHILVTALETNDNLELFLVLEFSEKFYHKFF